MHFSSDIRATRESKEVIKDLYFFHENPMLDCNQYVISDASSGDLFLFDAGNGLSLNGLIESMKRLDLDYLDVTQIYLTHEHVDHVLGLYPLMKFMESNPPEIFAYGETANILKEGNEAKIFPGNLGIQPSMFGVEIVPLKVRDLNKGNDIKLGSEFNFQIYYTPGHSTGSISYYEPDKKILIPGDLVFTGGSFGRYDFPGGSLKMLIDSIKFINDLDVNYLLPGHMGITDKGNQQIALSYRMIQSIGNYF